MIYNREEARNLLGYFCNDLNLLRDRTKDINLGDFDDLFHKTCFGAILNLSLEKDIKNIDGFTLDSYLKKFPVQYERFRLNQGCEFIEAIKTNCTKGSFEYALKTVKKMSLLRRYDSVGMDIKELYDYETLDVEKVQKQRGELDKASLDDIKHFFKSKLVQVDSEFQTKSDNYYFSASDDLDELIESCKNQKSWGRGFQSNLYNALFRGMLGSKFFIRSGGTGSGKSRFSLGDMCYISAIERFNIYTGNWDVNPKPEDSLFISTELTKQEVQLVMLANISGVAEEVIKSGKYTNDEEYRILRAKDVIKNSKLHCEYNSNFSISELEDMIEKHIIRNNVKYVFFDYMQITSNLSQELTRLFGYVLREDQMLNQLSTSLKNIANKYDIFIISSTQINRSYKSDNYIDVTSLRGGMATADKCDYVVISMSVSKADLEKLNPILEIGFNDKPTHAHHVCKNRGGKWSGVIIWVNADLDTVNIKDLFVTTQDFELINTITPIILK